MSSALDRLAAALVAARSGATALPFADWHDVLKSADQAYGVQDRVGDRLAWFPGFPKHWKSGGPSRESVLTHAPLAPNGVRKAPADFSDMHFNAPAMEGEMAFRLGASVSPAQAAVLTPAEAPRLVESMAVSIEIVDARWAPDAQAPALLQLADSQSHGALAIGDWVPFAQIDWATQTCAVQVNGHDLAHCTGTHPLKDPAWLLALWLRHATRHGATVPAGTVVTTGSWVGALTAQAGSAVAVEFKGIGSASLRL